MPIEEALTQIFGNSSLDLLRQDGSTVKATSALSGKKYLMLYLSGSWCRPCRLFTPQLATFYESFHEKLNFEVVFVSQDRDARSMLAYFFNPKYSRSAVRGGEGSHGNWLALPYEQASSLSRMLMWRHKISGIPTLLLFDMESGKLMTRKARDLVMHTLETAEGFPWEESEESVVQDSGWRRQVFLGVVFLLLMYCLWK
ncbi:tryparedoxin [Trypanosoma theileri]|uniref:Tryparedoxin n=1 Tax=Trypanosoma theileri TaxID=67003 RepID=A0A1X0P190_9TRYP|nr:tryparedoxin [Trypanosoma theileri]ORC90180.1 tryparedoxin [Trypanosoma theileri]